MTTDFTKQQRNAILSTLDATPRNPANKAAALKAIEKSAKTLGLSLDNGLVDGRMPPARYACDRRLRRRSEGGCCLVSDGLLAPHGASRLDRKRGRGI